jgi:hypothetical protein
LRSKSKIRKIHHRIVLATKHVLRFDVSVSDATTVAPIHGIQDLQVSRLDQAILRVKYAAFNDSGEKVASRAIIQGSVHKLLVVVEASNGNDVRMVADKPLKRDLSRLSSRLFSPLTHTLDGEDRAGLDLESTIDGAETTGAYLFDEFDLARPNGHSSHIRKISRREVHDATEATRAKDLYATRAMKKQKVRRCEVDGRSEPRMLPLTFPSPPVYISASESLFAKLRVQGSLGAWLSGWRGSWRSVDHVGMSRDSII